ncbi:MAG TPA: ESX secretion-associated protein EspG [Pseudonocardiaceae bacterium]|jgi:hypothetical protein|nr:ESX secretion-associated protein EspG [Pseudonocardiaceae bacterium]
MAEGFACSQVELDIIGEALRLNVRPFPFDFPNHGDTLPQRRQLAGRVQESLTERGLIRGTSFAPVVPDLVGLYAAARWSVTMLGTAGRRSLCVRAGSDGKHAVMVAQHGDQMEFTPVAPAALVRAVVSLLPPLRPGPGSSVTVALADLSSGSLPKRDEFSSGSFMQPVTPARGHSGTQQAVIEAILRRPRTGAGYFVATVRGRNGRESEPATLTWIDTDAGRYALIPDGRGYVTCTPADLPRIDQHLARQMSTLD